jgi:nicotinamide riboside transporter PnuC
MMQIEFFAKVYCNLFFFFFFFLSGVGVWRWKIQEKRANENNTEDSAEKSYFKISPLLFLASVRRHYTLAKSLKYTLFLKKLVILLVTSF